MNKLNFKASLAKAAFALATVLTLSLAFTACSNDNPGPGPDPKPDPDPEKPTVELKDAAMIDNVEKKVTRTEIVKNEFWKRYEVCLFLSDNSYVLIAAHDEQNDKPIDLTKAEGKWSLVYAITHGNNKFLISNNRSHDKFDRGTMRWKLNEKTGEFSVEVKDGYISQDSNKDSDSDHQSHTFALKWNGTLDMPKPNPNPNPNPSEPDENKSAVINSKRKEVVRADIFTVKGKLKEEEHTAVRLFFKDDSYIYIGCFKGMDDSWIDLTGHDYRKWLVAYCDKDGSHKFMVADLSANNKCDKGNLYWYLYKNGQFRVEIKDAHISPSANTHGDKQDYTFSLKWNGTPEKVNSAPARLTRAVRR